jgi:EPS-associated MarR family transcriptional regulator
LTNLETEFEILRRANKETSQRAIASDIGYSVGKVNYVLKKLASKGLVKLERFIISDKKAQYKYLLIEKGIKEKIILTNKFIQVKKDEYDKLQEEMKEYKEKYSNINFQECIGK